MIKRRKIIDQIDINGNIIKTYMSLDDAANDLNINPKRISSVVTGSRKHYKKMIFKYH